MSGDEILTMVWISLVLFGGGGVLWLRVIQPIYQEFVKPFWEGHFTAKTTYVTPQPPTLPDPSRSAQEREPEREPEPAERPAERPTPPETFDTQVRPTYTDEQLDRAKRTARDQGAAEAIGTLIGLGLLSKDRESEVLERLYGKRGRRWQQARPTIQDVAARVSTPATERPPLKVKAGTAEEYEISREEEAK
jgi:hypothetical protein